MKPNLIASVVLATLLAWGNGAFAQNPGSDPTPQTVPDIELDGSIGPGGDVPFDQGTDTWQIGEDLGEYNDSGSSLFHSFGRFGVSQGDTAEFSAQLGSPDRVFARVTWGELSSIEGTLRNAIPGADLYLINPAGIRFGGGATIDVQGSFYATTAGRIEMQEGASFEAYGDAAPPVLSLAEPSAFGFLPASSEMAGEPILFFAVDDALSVPQGETFAAIGGQVTVLGGSRPVFSSPGSQISLIAAGPDVDVPHDLSSFDPSDLPPGTELGEVVIRDARIFASFPSGSILVRGGDFELADGALLAAIHRDAPDSAFPLALDVAVQDEIRIAGDATINVGTIGEGRSGDVVFSGATFSLSGESTLQLAATSSAASPNLSIVAGDRVEIESEGSILSRNTGSSVGGNIAIEAREFSLRTGGRVISETTSSGQGGAIAVDAERMSIDDTGFGVSGTFVAATTTGGSEAPGGDIDLVVDQIELRSGGQIFTSTASDASAGRVSIVADSVEVSGSGESGGEIRVSAIEARALQGSSGAAGRSMEGGSIVGVSLDAERVSIEDGATIGSFTFGTGAAGDVVAVARDRLALRGGNRGFATLISRAFAPAGQPVVGDSGSVIVETGRLLLEDGGQITTSTSGTGDAGLVDIRSGAVEIRGTGGANESGLFSQTIGTQAPEMGAGGSIRLDVEGRFAMRDGARIAVETRNDADAGDIEIVAGNGVSMADGATISAASVTDATGRPGSIRINAGPKLEMVDSSISTESLSGINPGGGRITIVAEELVSLTNSSIDTSVARGGGDGGDISIDPDLVILNSSEVLANAFDGNGGRIFIRAGAFVQSADSVVQASSLGAGSGIDGEVIIESPDSDLTTGATQLPQQYLDASGLMKTACAAREAGLSSLVVTRIAGLPATPHGPLPSRLWDDAWLQDARDAVAQQLKEELRDAGSTRIASVGSSRPPTEVVP